MERAGARFNTAIEEELAVGTGLDAPIDVDRREANNYVLAVHFVLQSNYPKYIAEPSNDQLDRKQVPQEPCSSV